MGKGMRLDGPPAQRAGLDWGNGGHFCMETPERSPRQGLAPPYASFSLARLHLPLISSFIIATWGPAGGILRWKGMGWWHPCPEHHHRLQGGSMKGNRVLGGMKHASPKFTRCIGVPVGGRGAGPEGRCSTTRPERLRVPLTG